MSLRETPQCGSQHRWRGSREDRMNNAVIHRETMGSENIRRKDSSEGKR